MSRSIMARIVALVVVTIVGFYYILFDAIGIHVINKPYTVHVVMPAAGGLYPDAYVTYRGVEIGKVASVHLAADHVVADLALNHGSHIPDDVTASVRELTAAAEQYLDLVPAGSSGGYLRAGATIPESRTSIPVSVGVLLNTVNTLVDSLHATDLNTLSRSLATGLQGAGDDLRSIIVDGSSLADALHSAIPGTQELINAGDNVLSTFNATSGEFTQFNADLNLLTQQVAQSNSNFVALLQSGAHAGTTLDQFLSQTANPTISLIDNLSTATGIAFDRQAAVQALFQVLPVLSNDLALVTTGGQLRFEIKFNIKNTVCPYTSVMAEPTSLVPLADLTRTCSITAPDLLQRGADKAPTG